MASWMNRAACRGEDTDLFFPLGHGPQFDAQIAQAKAVCRRCPVSGDCLAAALVRPDRYGVFGGLTEVERGSLRRNDRRRRHPQYTHLWEEVEA